MLWPGGNFKAELLSAYLLCMLQEQQACNAPWDVAGEQPQHVREHGVYTLANASLHPAIVLQDPHIPGKYYPWECSNAAVSKQKRCARQCHSCNIQRTPALFFLHSRIKTHVLDCCFSLSIWMRLLQNNCSQEFFICRAKTYRPICNAYTKHLKWYA